MTGTRYRTWRIGPVAGARYTEVGISAHGINRILGLPAAPRILGALAVTPRSLAASTWWRATAPLHAVLRPLPGWPQRSRSTGADPLPG